MQGNVKEEAATVRDVGAGCGGQDDRSQQISWHAIAGRKYNTAVEASSALAFGFRLTSLMVMIEEARSLTRFFFAHVERDPGHLSSAYLGLLGSGKITGY